jgi:hypothetical protein
MNSGPSHANAKWYGIAAFQPFVLNLQQGRTGSRWLIERRLILFVCQFGTGLGNVGAQLAQYGSAQSLGGII